MIKVGMNYMSEIPKEVVQNMVREGVIDVLKFPGLRCNLEELEQFFKDLPKQIQADPHGLLNFNPAWNMPNIAEKAGDAANRKLVSEMGGGWFSTHIGQFPGGGDPITNFWKNLADMREMFPNIQLGGENVFSLVDSKNQPRYMTLESSSPDFINQMWQYLDFGVFDITHAKIAARDQKMSFEDYMRALNPEKVRIIHITGTRIDKEATVANELDTHGPCREKDFEDLVEVLHYFTNTHLVVSELVRSVNEKGEFIPLKVEDYEKEARNLSKIVKGL